MSPQLQNIHATAVICGDRGILIRGPSGSGKTALALTLLQHANRDGRHAALIGDDQLFIEAQAGRVLAFAPPAIAGLAEAHGLGPRRIVCQGGGQIDLVVDLVDAGAAPRFQEAAVASLAGVELACLSFRAEAARGAYIAIAAWFNWPPFGE